MIDELGIKRISKETVQDGDPDGKQNEESIGKRITGSLSQDLIRINDCCFRYGMRYMAKVLQDALHHKFPDAPEKDVLKIVGNLIYYRYINSAIVAPDAFDIIDVTAHKGLTNDQRRNLGSVAKILQFAASNKGVSVRILKQFYNMHDTENHHSPLIWFIKTTNMLLYFSLVGTVRTCHA